ncbi:glycoside hydrolase family 3 N-terminal domain-containing protein [Kribbella speibonae]|uniref:Beta-glucosidase n=1 Tax=Kribbella speibonae TaxID=1572660 RepID=A0A4R0IV24_9ACTN|nr:glycoside hydrolase family 3 N-terminal domain-containing protein [Kribbella speibonae]TCC36394.1 beta-glucosidase [Kribbella speibonae]
MHHLDASLPSDARAELLLQEMTLAEKCHQLTSVMPWSLVRPDGADTDSTADLLKNPPGHVAQLIVDDPAKLADLVGAIQQRFVTRTRLGVPAFLHAEALSGFLAGGHMSFPTGTGLAATWSPELVQEMADLIRQQMRRVGMPHALSPVMDIALDPRWGRVHETYGEDPYLCAALSVAYTRGLQGDDLARGVIATGKHFLGYGLPAGGANTSAFDAGARRTRDLFAYPIEAAIQLAGLKSVMNSYGTVDGIPVGVSREALTDLLRGTLGFDGFVSADYTTLEKVVADQRVASTPGDAARLAITAGLDVELPKPFAYGAPLIDEVRRGAVEVSAVDVCVRRVLKAKFDVGLFENPYPAEHIDVHTVAVEGRELSEELAERSVVLVKNNGILPLAPGTQTVAVIGPHADTALRQLATYTYPAWREAVNAMSRGDLGNMLGADAIIASWYDALLTPVDPEKLVRDRYGVHTLSDEIGNFAAAVRTEQASTFTEPLGSGAIDRAVAIAHEADVVVLALGGASLWFNGERTEGEASDSADISLPAVQTELAEAVAAIGKPLVAVLVQGRAYALPEVIKDAAAIVIAPFGGPFGTKAITRVLFGATNPSGKLPYSIPRGTGQIPVYHHQHAGTGYRNPVPPSLSQHYLDLEATPLYPFAHGLSYADFDLADRTGDSEIDTSGSARISALVTNTGAVKGATVVQLYLRVNTIGVTRPAQQLAGFSRLELAPGESKRVTFTIAATQLGYTNLVHDFAVEPARVDYFLGFDSDDQRLQGHFELVGEPRVLTSAQRSFLSEVSHA